jgi:hypothetical protein
MSVITFGPKRSVAERSPPPSPRGKRQSSPTSSATNAFSPGESCNENLNDYIDMDNIIAFGDIHGDIEALKSCMKLSKCVDDSGAWIAPAGTAVVILGDCVDRYRDDPRKYIHEEIDPTTGLKKSLGERKDEELMVLDMLNSLAAAASVAGSVVVRLVGNHELMQSENNVGYVKQRIEQYSFQKNYTSPYQVGGTDDDHYAARQKSFLNGDFHDKISECKPKVIVQVGSHVFVHGGINLQNIEYANGKGRSLIELANEILERHLKTPLSQYDPDYEFLMNGGAGRKGKDPAGLLWDESMSAGHVANDTCVMSTKLVQAALNRNLATYGLHHVKKVEHFVVSHCQQFSRDKDHLLGQVPANTKELFDIDAEDFTTKGVADDSRRFKTSDLNNRTINCLCDGLVWRVDVGMSRSFTFSYKRLNINEVMRAQYTRAMSPAILMIEDDGFELPEYTVRQTKTLLPGVADV